MALDLYQKKTFCNPLSMPNCPHGTDGPMKDADGYLYDYRSISDPSVLYYGDKWYLYPSYDMAYVSEDFVTWKYVPCTPEEADDSPRYSPCVIPWRGKFLMTIHSERLYVGDTPTGPFRLLGDFILPDGTHFRPTDPALFADDDGRIYMYWHDSRTHPTRGVWSSLTRGAELDADNPRRLLGEPRILNEFDPSHAWERFGEYNQNTEMGWIEGQWMLKHNGRYYLIYAACGTQFGAYAMGAYYSDAGPLEGFVYQKNNPVTFHKTGLVKGAGHGCIEHGPGGSLWAFYTCTMCYAHCFERRIGMDRIEIDANGELYCPGITDTPQYGATESKRGSTGLLPLTFSQRAKVRSTSHTEGRDSLYALDESMLTWWQPAVEDAVPVLTVNLEAPYELEASRIIWRDIGLSYEKGVYPGAFRYKIEAGNDGGGTEWRCILDMTGNREDYNIDYKTFPPVTASAVRLVITGAPKGVCPGVVSFTVFGKRISINQ
ncbi:MAG: family 43 glycosylhydrolase [Clostridiaceae bacterium]|nr:family 43 glycosylhydrolase [Clostridiaceae bacterium]